MMTIEKNRKLQQWLLRFFVLLLYSIIHPGVQSQDSLFYSQQFVWKERQAQVQQAQTVHQRTPPRTSMHRTVSLLMWRWPTPRHLHNRRTWTRTSKSSLTKSWVKITTEGGTSATSYERTGAPWRAQSDAALGKVDALSKEHYQCRHEG